MIKAVLQAVVACFLWGAIFAVPLYLEEYSSVDIALGRFFFYGIISIFLLVFYILLQGSINFIRYWKQALLCAIIMNLIHFVALTFGLRLVSPALITVIMGISPISITIASCIIRKEMHLLSVFLMPSISIFLGLGLMNIEELQQSDVSTLSEYVEGVLYGLVALGTWTWYVIYNADFMSKNKDINSGQWTALIGLMTLVVTLASIAARYFQMGNDHFYQFSWSHEDGRFFLLSVFSIAVFCSWVAFAVWNAASVQIPPILGGQLSILETIFGLLFVYTIQQKIPSMLEFVGVVFILAGISFGLYAHMKEEFARATS